MFLTSISSGKLLIVIVIIINIYIITSVEGRKCVCTSKDCKEAGENTCETKYFCYTELIPISDNRKIGENTTTRGCTQSPTPLLCETKSWITRSKLSPSLSSLSSSSFDNRYNNKENDTIENNRLLSSTIPWIRMSWPRLKCCDSQDYCNADYLGDVSKYLQEIEKDKNKLNKIDKEEEEKEEEVEEEEEEEGNFFIKKMNYQNNITYQNQNTNIPANNNPQLSNRIDFHNQIQSIDSYGRSTNNSSSRERIISLNSDSFSITVNESSNIDDDTFQHQIRPLHIAAVVLAISALVSVFAACYVITRLLKSDAYIIGNTE